MSDLKSDILIVRNRKDWKVQARKNELQCKNCGNICFWVTMLKSKLKIQCINCYEYLEISGFAKGIKKLSESTTTKLLPVGETEIQEKYTEPVLRDELKIKKGKNK